MLFREYGTETVVQGPQTSGVDGIPLTIGLAGGGYVVVWQTNDGDIQSDVRARIYDPFGTPRGAAFTIFNDYIGFEFPHNVDVIALPDGGFAVASVRIQSLNGVGGAATSDIALQFFNADGNATTGVLSASTSGATSTIYVSQPELTLAGNQLVVAWDGGEAAGSTLNARAYSLTGTAATATPLTLDAGNAGTVTQAPAIAGFTSGSTIAVWREGVPSGSSGDAGDIRAQVYNANGTAIAASFLVNTNTAGTQTLPHVSVLANGNAIVTWGDLSSGTMEIHGQLLSSTGAKIGGEFVVATTAQTGDTNLNDYGLTALNDGGFAVAWHDQVDNRIYVREFNASGVALRGETSLSNGTGFFPHIDALAGSGYEVTWSNSGTVYAQTVAELRTPIVNDFNGDNHSDILLRNASTGVITQWISNGDSGTFTTDGNPSYALPSEWKLVATGDFNGDNKTDLIFQTPQGSTIEWLGRDGNGFAWNEAATYQVGSTSTIAAAGDFNGDGRSDLAIHNSDGTYTTWFGKADGTFITQGNPTYQLPTDWNIAATGDFNGDGRSDLLLRNSVGTIMEWLGQANNTFAFNPNAVYSLDTSWKVAVTGDINGDGRDDVVLRNDNGTITEWLGQSNGTLAANGVSYALPANWTVAAAADYNGDGHADLLIRSDQGSVIEFMGQANGGFTYNTAANYSLDLNWHTF